MKLADTIETNILLRNNTPINDFLGLSPNQIHYLLYDTFNNKSPVQFLKEIDETTLDQIPLFRITEEYLKIIHRDKHIKLTPLGALPKKVIVELYDKRILLDDHIESGITKLWKEDDCISIRSARLTAELTGLVKKNTGKLTLTKKATKLLESNNRMQIFKLFFQAFTDKFDWSFNDGYPKQPIGQLGWAFSIIMINRFGDEPHTVDFYAAKYLRAFPKLITFFQDHFLSVEKQFIGCYNIRTFIRFFIWFGFVTVDEQGKYNDFETNKFKQTNLVKNIFNIMH